MPTASPIIIKVSIIMLRIGSIWPMTASAPRATMRAMTASAMGISAAVRPPNRTSSMPRAAGTPKLSPRVISLAKISAVS